MFRKERRLKGKAFQREFAKIKPLIAERDNYCCRLCGRKADDIHHIVFRSQGGTNEEDNLICLCRACHEKAHGIDADAVREVLRALVSLT